MAYPADPLVPHPGGGFSAWWNPLWLAFGRSWKQLLPIVALTSALPGVLLTVVGVEFLSRSFTVVDDGVNSDVTVHWGVFGAFVGLGVVLGIVALFATAIGWSGAIWLVTRQAAGAPAKVGDALIFGARRCLRLGGLLVVVGLMVAAGLVACFLPGLYLGVAASLVVPVCDLRPRHQRDRRLVPPGQPEFRCGPGPASDHVSARRRRVRRSQPDRFDDRGRMATPRQRTPTPAGARSSARPSVSAIVSVPTTMFLIIGILMTYAQMRARAVPTTAHDLVSSLGA